MITGHEFRIATMCRVLQVARELGVERSVLKAWVDNVAVGRYEKDRTLPLKAAQQIENEQLRRELAKVLMERDILKKAQNLNAKKESGFSP